ncbi:hypothetical protein GALL_525370 [mine drainage metagenome]|uniref:Uncharacterized protein n=1 Tax=mine drainage metagenome TaxID=410659 RepID=A0A1J5PQN8_9ZZZZ
MVAQAPPTAPSAGRPKLPGTSRRSTLRFTPLAIHIMAAAALGRERPSSQKLAATLMAYPGREKAKTTKGREAPSARSFASPSTCSRTGPPAMVIPVETAPIHRL